MNTDETLTNLRAAVAAAAAPAERAGALNQLAEALDRHGEYAESLAAAKEAEAIAQQSGNVLAETGALRLQGVVHYRRSDYSGALPLFEQSLQLYEELGERSGAARVTGNIGLVYANLSEYSKA